MKGSTCRAETESEGKMRTARLQELEEMAAKLLATARKLPPGQDHHNALQEISSSRADSWLATLRFTAGIPRRTEGKRKMTGPRPAGRPWTLTDDDMLRKLLVSGMKHRRIAQRMKRSIGAVQSRIYLLKKARKRQERGRLVELRLEAKKMSNGK
jgi:hypothetical protein